MMSIEALNHHLAPLKPFLEMDGVTEICINKPVEIFVERRGQFQSYDVAELDYSLLETLAALVAEFNDQTFPAPFISGRLPTRERIQFVMNPACERQKIICSIRRQQMREMTLHDYEASGAFDHLRDQEENEKSDDDKLQQLLRQKNYLQLIDQAILNKKNILISGGTGTGKTTFLNTCLKRIPLSERLITIEDTREVNVTHPNAVNLLFNEDDERMTSLQVFKACLRLRPDRIFLSELRGKEVWPYLRAANSGHPGSLSTVHADSPEGAITQLIFMMQQAGTTSNEEQIRNYIQSIIHIIIQLKRDPRPGKFVQVKEVWIGDGV
jgi:type IV secretion system protein VirB11